MKFCVAALLLAAGPMAIAGDAGCVRIKIQSEVRQKAADGHGHTVVRLVSADKLGVGDEVFYTVAATNTCGKTAANVVIDSPVPRHMIYVAGSAIAPASFVLFSVDGGFHYAPAGELTVTPQGEPARAARPEEYTHIRWVMSKPLEEQAVVFARFRAVVK